MVSMRKSMHILARMSVVTVCALSLRAQAQAIDAGVDQVVKSDQTGVKLRATVDDGYDSLTWSQASGPAQAAILSVSTPISTVTFPQAGVYLFGLRAYYPALVLRDTAKITVEQSLPFTVLAPANLQEIEIGKPFTIRWQMDPPLPCRVSYSLDGGLDYTVLSLEGAVGGDGNMQFVWNVGPAADARIVAGAQGIVKVNEYGKDPNNTTGTFVLVDHSAVKMTEYGGAPRANGPEKTSDCGTGAGLALLPPLWLKLAGRRRRKG